MPYYYFEEEQEGFEQADVVERTELDEVQARLSEITEQRDQAVERAVSAEKGLAEAKQKYADTFLTTPSRIMMNHEEKNMRPTSIDSLFGREN